MIIFGLLLGILNELFIFTFLSLDLNVNYQVLKKKILIIIKKKKKKLHLNKYWKAKYKPLGFKFVIIIFKRA